MVRGVPWTHSAIVRLIRDADEDGDGKLSFREVSSFFLQITSILFYLVKSKGTI